MKSERIRGTTESSLSELSGSSVCSKSNRGVSRKATSFDLTTCGGDGPNSTETSNEIDRHAEKSPAAQTNPRRSIDDNVKSEKQSENASLNEMNGKMYLIDKLLGCEDHSKTKCSIDDQLRSTDVMVENDSGFDRYDVEDSQSFSGDHRDGDTGSFSSSWLLGAGDIISGGRYLFPEKLAGTVAVKFKGRKRHGRKKTLARRQGRSERPKSSRGLENGNPSEGLPLSPQLIGFGEDCGKYFANSSAAPSRRKREQQIKDVYAATAGENTRAPVAIAGRTTDRSHEASSFINRKMRSREITRVNKIIADKILNVRTTIPKTKK
ncbi:uncharacterized protein LOC132923801 [Rhopalosiphum padi]|uniref:uncharacterized protein LOC132923801 n=1 Tax=Rhopalosiphum padi TaxID=40932 RepID=UPI00298E06B6|nr:uncharacterized protein LOC132923801 [Rhopalosiphum padi]